jgi:metal-responsive CopG/Arc/MetJ family transcriptional regulator
MPKTKIAVTVEASLLDQLDELIAEDHFPNRSRAVEAALAEKLARLRRTRLARECAKLDPEKERAWADQGLHADLEQWPEY